MKAFLYRASEHGKETKLVETLTVTFTNRLGRRFYFYQPKMYIC